MEEKWQLEKRLKVRENQEKRIKIMQSDRVVTIISYNL
jgi:hypothetical protein